MVFPWKYSKIDLVETFLVYHICVIYIIYTPSLGEEVVSCLDSFQGGNGGLPFSTMDILIIVYNSYVETVIALKLQQPKQKSNIQQQQMAATLKREQMY